MTEKGSTLLSDCRQGKNKQHAVLAMLRQSVYGRLAAHEDVNDAKRLRVDPAKRLGADIGQIGSSNAGIVARISA